MAIGNLIEQEDMAKGLPDDVLMREAEQPSGQLPQFLLISEVKRRADMRKRYQLQMQEMEPTVAEQIMQEGIAGVAQPPPEIQQAMNGGPPPMQPPMNVSPQPMAVPPPMAGPPQQPPTQMAYQGGVVGMQNGGTFPGLAREKIRQMQSIPNVFIEDGNKFNPASLGDISSTEMSMAQPVNMGIPSVVPMAYGGIVKMQDMGQVPDDFGSMRDLPEGMTREKFQELSEEEQNRYLQSLRDTETLTRELKSVAAPPAWIYDKLVLDPLKAVSEMTGAGDYASRAARALSLADKTKPTAFEGPQIYGESMGMVKNWLGQTSSARDAEKYLRSPIDAAILYGTNGTNGTNGTRERINKLVDKSLIKEPEFDPNLKGGDAGLGGQALDQLVPPVVTGTTDGTAAGIATDGTAPLEDLPGLLKALGDLRKTKFTHPYKGLEEFITRSEGRSAEARKQAKYDAGTQAIDRKSVV